MTRVLVAANQAVVPAVRHVPDASRSHVVAGDHEPAVRGKGRGKDRTLVPPIGTDLLPRRHRPDLDGLILTTAHKHLTIWTKSDGVHQARMSSERLEMLARFGIP